MAQRVTQHIVELALGTGGTAKVSGAQSLIALGQPDIVRVGNHHIVGALGEPGPVRATDHRFLFASSPHRVIEPDFVESGEIFSYTVELVVPDIETPEVNPYRPTVPEEYNDVHPVLFDFQLQMQEVLRLQHNVTQMGDTTFHWSYMVKRYREKLYNLGSVGRFYHPDYGVLVARFVQFDKMLDSQHSIAPVGFVKDSINDATFSWKVTNDYSKSDPHLALGIMMMYERPENDEFGWVVICGPNLGSILYDGSDTPPQNTPLIWGANFTLTDSGSGRILARTWEQGIPGSALAKLLCQTEGFSDDYYIGLFEASFEEITDELEILSTQVAALQTLTGSAGLSASITALQASVASLSSRLTQETSSRLAIDQGLREDITALQASSWTVELAAVENTLTLLVQATAATLNVGITNLSSRVSTLETLIATSGLDQLATNLNAINDAVVALNLRVTELEKHSYLLPVVLGTNPAEFVVDDDGNLIYVSINDGF